ncbi:Ig domain-containing protein [Hoeflea olei]|uniref:Dystroglycan-type cadherin-like domain-containing protein n=2 Tax=Hoeflea olei TaxID=1480615 RepID=A0A1C1YX48_9HYPH|nr:Ig domain-containing protein [Hoeflea olei]OCW57966.1 hypothetical protein AWJ14_04035 [Hoeflea olei]
MQTNCFSGVNWSLFPSCGLFRWLLLPLWALLLAFVFLSAPAMAAQSTACTTINSEWGGGKSLSAPPLASQTVEGNSYSGFAVGETLTWTANGTSVQGSGTYVNYWITDDIDYAWEDSAESQTTGSLSDTGSHTFAAGESDTVWVEIALLYGTPGDTAEVTMSVTCTPPGGSVTITLSPAAGALNAGQVGTAYTQTITASGGTAPYSYAVTSGSLPAGLTLSTGGVLSGTPTTAASASFTVTATDANNDTGDAAYTLQVNAAPVVVTLSPAAGALNAGQVGTAYTQTITASGGTAPYSYAVTSGSLPAGLTLSTGGVLSGTPTTAASASFTVTATDANNDTGDAAYTLQVNAAPVVVTLSPAAGALNAGQVGRMRTTTPATRPIRCR